MAGEQGPAVWAAGGLIAAAVVWYVWSHQGRTHNTEPTLEAAFAPEGYHAYAWWVGHGHRGPARFAFPERLMMNTSPETLQEAEGTLSVARSEAGNG